MSPRTSPICDHAGFHSAQTRYSPAQARLRFIIVCDDCSAELTEIGNASYRPLFDPEGSGMSPGSQAG